VALCRALIRKPQLLLADEPTGQLDEELSQQVATLLLDINRKLGTTIIIVTHSEELARKAQRQFYLQEGNINEI
jgi:ABC-type lipoprotein export system ATPase subunit